MSTNTPGPSVSGTALVWAITAMFIAVVAGSVMLAVGLEDSQNPAGLVALLLGAFATLVTSLGTLLTVSRIRSTQQGVAEKVEHLANGGGDAKVEAAVRRVLEERDPPAQTDQEAPQ